MRKRNLLFYLRPLTWFAERWVAFFMLFVISVAMFNLSKLLGVLTVVFSMVYFIHRYIAWDLIEQYFDRE